MHRSGGALLAALVLVGAPAEASAFTTRVHIVLSNEIRAALIESGDGTIELRWSEHAVRIPREDADAIINQPLAFRAGAIGPDNVVFPAMTDGTHGVEQDPYRQCELLYVEALTEAERAYALGCFLHGATDAVAHHFVNYFTGETFTLTPISAARESSYDNVIGHMVTESVIQSSLHAADPSLFSAGQLQHALPHDFLLRTYFHTDSPVWGRLSQHAMTRWDAARAADLDGNVLGWARSAGFAPWEQIAMAPVYVAELQRLRGELRAWIEGEIADMADPTSSRGSTLGVTAGADGVIGTPDDDTACTASCPTLAGQYYVYVNILAPRYDAGGRELPSAFDVLSRSLGDQLYGFLPALVRVIDNLSAILNAPIPASDTSDHGFDVTAADISTTFAPLTDWVNGLIRTTDAGFDGLADAITPAWYRGLSDFLTTLGVDITVGNVLRLVFGPVIERIRDTLVQEVRGRAEAFVTDLASEYRSGRDGWQASVEARLSASAPSGLGAHALDFAPDAGLLAYSFNLTAVAFARHDVLLVSADPIGSGPASFDASYTPEWTQIGVCDYLREAVFPRGTGVAPLLSVEQGGSYFGAAVSDDSPVECHAGALDAFGAPSTASCAHTSLEALLGSRVGSLSRAFPPDFAAGDPRCLRLTVPGLPEPPPMPDAGPGSRDAGAQTDDAAMGADGGMAPPSAGGCGCAVPERSGSEAPLGLALLALVALALRRRRRSRRASLALVALFAVACDAPVTGTDSSTPGVDGGRDAFVPDMDADVPDPDGGMDGGIDGGTRVDAGPDPRRELLDALSGSVWSGLLERDEGGSLVSRAYEMRFDTRDLRWAEIRNPFGPARQRVLRSFNPRPDGVMVESTVMIPTGWETPEPLRGLRETWEFEVVDSTPRVLRITNTTTLAVEELEEGAWPAPDTGLTAEVRVFGASGAVHDAFCGSGSFDRSVIWEFARGTGLTAPLSVDAVAGAQLTQFANTAPGNFGVTDVGGFDLLGGTEITVQSNFIVRYRGRVAHPGQLFMREANDDTDLSALWVFLGANVDTGGISQVFLEVHPFASADATCDVCPGSCFSASCPGGTVPSTPGEVEIEIMIIWCGGTSLQPTTPQISLDTDGGPWMLLRDATTRPALGERYFPPAL